MQGRNGLQVFVKHFSTFLLESISPDAFRFSGKPLFFRCSQKIGARADIAIRVPKLGDVMPELSDLALSGPV